MVMTEKDKQENREIIFRNLKDMEKSRYFGGATPKEIEHGFKPAQTLQRLKELEKMCIVESNSGQLTGWQNVWCLSRKGKLMKLSEFKKLNNQGVRKGKRCVLSLL